MGLGSYGGGGGLKFWMWDLIELGVSSDVGFWNESQVSYCPASSDSKWFLFTTGSLLQTDL